MLLREEVVRKYSITEVAGLDPVTLYLEDHGTGQGTATITCYGKSWTSYWGAMGDETIAEFLNTADKWYLAKNFSSIDPDVVDYDAISDKIGNTVDRETLMAYEMDVIEAYGPDWYFDLPKVKNPEYEYLLKIIDTVKAAVAQILEEANGTD